MMKELRSRKAYSGKSVSKSGRYKGGVSVMDANSKNFEVELMAQEQLKEKVSIAERPKTAKML